MLPDTALNHPPDTPRTHGNPVIWAARACSLVLTCYWLFLAWLTLFISEDPLPVQGKLLLVLALLACVGLLLSWRRPRLGGGLTVAASIAQWATTLITYDGSPAEALLLSLPVTGPLLLGGVLFLVAGKLETGVAGASAWHANVLAVLLAAMIIVTVLAMVAVSLGLGVTKTV